MDLSHTLKTKREMNKRRKGGVPTSCLQILERQLVLQLQDARQVVLVDGIVADAPDEVRAHL